ncbi:MAG: hypothetical protein EOM80_08760 [Erysipelotrichia bacterium]|nr:hypothetical protein [Erysipelotrichia bacterium]
MKKLGGLLVMVAVMCSFGAISWAEEVASATASATEVVIPDSTDMTLGFKEDAATPKIPEKFLGGDPDHSLVHCLEDVYYEKHEHSLIYKEDAAEIAEGAKFVSEEPNITWDTKVKDADGNWQTMSSENTNVATDGGKFYAPGEYQIGNSGARQVGAAEGAADVASTTGDPAAAADGGKTVTAQQSMGVEVHDITSPDLWIAFEEGAGNVDMAATEQELKEKMIKEIALNLGRPFSTKAEDYEKASYLFVDEGEADERNLEPFKKTARLSVAGALFNERGLLEFKTKELDAKHDEEMTSVVTVSGGEKDAFKGIFVRRNVPFIFGAMSVDNGDGRKSVGEVACTVEDKDGKEVQKVDGAFLFRVPNYPRESYKDQPEYFFVAKSIDKSGNQTNVRTPLCVVNTQASFESGSNQ